MKMWLDCDERYPDFSVREEGTVFNVEVEVTENELKQIHAARDAYDAAQALLADKYEQWKKAYATR